MPRRPVVLDRPLTPAERKARQRQRERRAVIEAIGSEEQAPTKALLALLAPLGAGREPDRAAYRAWLEIGRRTGWLRDGHIADPMEDS
jgi:hypothetical protein